MFIGVANLIPPGFLLMVTSNSNSGILTQDVEIKRDIEPRLCLVHQRESDQHTSGSVVVLILSCLLYTGAIPFTWNLISSCTDTLYVGALFAAQIRAWGAD